MQPVHFKEVINPPLAPQGGELTSKTLLVFPSQAFLPDLLLSRSPFLSFFFYSPLIAVIPGSFFPSMYSSIAPPPVET